MKFVMSDSDLLEFFLDTELMNGKHWVSYNAEIPRLSKDDLKCFSTIEDVKEYCYEQPAGLLFKYCTINKMLGFLEKAVQLVPRRKS